MTSLAEAGFAPSTEEWSDVINHLFNAVLFAGQNTQYVTEFRRKSFNKGTLAKDVPPDSSQLFGDDLAERLDAIDKAKKLVKSLEPARSNNKKSVSSKSLRARQRKRQREIMKMISPTNHWILTMRTSLSLKLAGDSTD